MARLSKNDRLLKRHDFLRVQRVGLRSKSVALVMIAKRSPQNTPGRVGLTVSKAVGKSHDRNLVKRRLRHLLRENRSVFLHRDLVIVAQPGSASMPFSEIRDQFLQTAKKLAELFNKHTGTRR